MYALVDGKYRQIDYIILWCNRMNQERTHRYTKCAIYSSTYFENHNANEGFFHLYFIWFMFVVIVGYYVNN